MPLKVAESADKFAIWNPLANIYCLDLLHFIPKERDIDNGNVSHPTNNATVQFKFTFANALRFVIFHQLHPVTTVLSAMLRTTVRLL
ncbi:hypothetical protein T01_10711 [Trichinella spiralis]|uniref:Uncharacterized protein n=1 Tax=Trichinella spiralis TaxID=6334 RepID=A0A0V1B5N6_TRISP|nr:hypothetical protein T01_10711 [Trichinella spiralis]